MRVALFGGTGFVGGYVVDALVAAGHEPSVLVRPGSESKVRQRQLCRLVAGAIDDEAAVEETLTGCDSAVYCIGILREFPRQGITYEALQYEGAVRVADAAKRLGARRVVLMSANGVKLPGTPYQETKHRAEEYLRSSGLDVTVFRPSVIFGDPRGLLEIATQLHRDMVAPPLPAAAFFSGFSPKRGGVTMAPVHVQDVADAFVRSLEDDTTVGRIIVLAGPEVLTWREMVERIAAATKRRKLIVPVPIGAMRIAAAALDWLPAFPVTGDQLKMLAEGNSGEPGPLEALIGRPARAFDAAALAYLG